MKGRQRLMEKGDLHGKHFTQLHCGHLKVNPTVQVRGFGLVHPFHNPSPKSPQPKIFQSFPSCRRSRPRSAQSLHLLVLAASSLCSRHSEPPARRGPASGSRLGAEQHLEYPIWDWDDMWPAPSLVPVSALQRQLVSDIL